MTEPFSFERAPDDSLSMEEAVTQALTAVAQSPDRIEEVRDALIPEMHVWGGWIEGPVRARLRTEVETEMRQEKQAEVSQ